MVIYEQLVSHGSGLTIARTPETPSGQIQRCSKAQDVHEIWGSTMVMMVMTGEVVCRVEDGVSSTIHSSKQQSSQLL